MKKPAGKGGGKPPVDDDDMVWQHTTRSLEPLKRGKLRVHPALERSSVAATSTPSSPKTPVEGSFRTKKQSAQKTELPLSSKPASSPPIADFDRRKVRNIRRGAVAIEARIDLHGMRQDEAHAALRAFILRCIGKGQRWVLVITGKGKPTMSSDDIIPRERGILKRNVPRWLDEPDLRPYVVSYATAAIAHGGEGALYLHLRTRGR